MTKTPSIASLIKPTARAPARFVFSDKRHQFHNATPRPRAALLNGPRASWQRMTITSPSSFRSVKIGCDQPARVGAFD